MPDKDVTAAWHQTDPRWRSSPTWTTSPTNPTNISSCCFGRSCGRPSPDQPEEFALFASCSAHLDLSLLELDEVHQKQLLYGLAGDGVPFPGTRFVLRVARPWYCAFRGAAGRLYHAAAQLDGGTPAQQTPFGRAVRMDWTRLPCGRRYRGLVAVRGDAQRLAVEIPAGTADVRRPTPLGDRPRAKGDR